MHNTAKKYNIFLIFIISGLLLCIRSKYGFSFNDEPFIISLAQRLFNGSSLLIDEWNTTQNFGVLILPFYALYTALFHTTEGILLAFRILYCVLWIGCCIIVYNTICQKYSGGIICYFYLLLFSPLDQMTVSYTSVSLMSCLLLGCLFFHHLEIRPISLPKFTLLFTALSIVAVISLPYLAAAYIGVCLFFVILHIIKKNEFSLFYFKVCLSSCIIAALVLVVYAYVFILNHHSLSDVIHNLQYIFQNSEYADASLIDSLIFYVKLIGYPYRLYGLCLAGSLALLLIPRIRRSPEIKLVLFIINACLYFREMITLYTQRNMYLFNQQIGPIIFLGVLALFLLDSPKKYIKMFACFSVFGVIYSICFFLASDTGLIAIMMGLSVSGVASIVFIAELYQQYQQYFKEKFCDNGKRNAKSLFSRIAMICFIAVFAVQLLLQGYFKAERQYWDSSMRNMKHTISVGAAKGLVTIESLKNGYETESLHLYRLLENVDYACREDIRFISLISNPVLYLNADLPVGSFSTWTFLSDEETLANQLNLYYSVNPDNIPNVIFCHETDTLAKKLQIDLSQYHVFQDGEYRLMVSPEFIKN